MRLTKEIRSRMCGLTEISGGVKMKAIVKEIQVGGLYPATSLESACEQFCYYKPPRAKIIFIIELPNGETKQITIRDENNETVAYGEFEGLPGMLDYAREVLGV